ncbi:rod shape-determining protein MreC [Candidatus Odyssella thessalonicensis]|uniref:rod shape-determining protein MreC n=1 Tax=Candidatus Odyssella thessalonicensis TaxID=84647 RepID=UPI0002FD3E89|nr:rod shape-determining protein MreC [Candidatus Odyssella thessalonicensis]
MRMLSVVGMKTSKDHRTTIISELDNSPTRLSQILSKFSKSFAVILVSAILVLLQVKDYSPVSTLRYHLTNFFSPVIYVVSLPFNWVASVGDYFKRKEDILAQNERLKLQNEQLIRERDIHRQISLENSSLREALNVQVGLVDDITTIRISHHVYDGYTTVLYSPTSSLGDLHKNDAILTTKGFLVGRVLDTDMQYTRIMPITDPASRIPVKIESSTQQAVLAGDGSPILNLVHIENPAGVRVGDRLVTSGVGGILPEGLPVAVVESVGNTIKCLPFGRVKDQDFVLALSRSGL